jgi:hypothetical protein
MSSARQALSGRSVSIGPLNSMGFDNLRSKRLDIVVFGARI